MQEAQFRGTHSFNVWAQNADRYSSTVLTLGFDRQLTQRSSLILRLARVSDERLTNLNGRITVDRSLSLPGAKIALLAGLAVVNVPMTLSRSISGTMSMPTKSSMPSSPRRVSGW